MESNYPHIEKHNGVTSFCDGKLIRLPREYQKKSSQLILDTFYENLDLSVSTTAVGKDPIGFNYVICKDICIIGLIIDKSKESKINTLKKKYPNHKFEYDFIIPIIEEERKLKNNEEYLPIRFVTQSIHELRNLNAKISSHIDDILHFQDDTWESIFDNADKNIKNIYVASRLIKFILDNVKFYLPNSIENVSINLDRNFVIHRSVSKIVKIFKNDFKKKKPDISLEGNCFRKMKGDKDFFEIALMLLIENAIKYSTDATGIPPKVIIKEHTNDVCITISSFGKIIPEKDRNSLFTRGFRSSAHSVKEGSGMGLHNAYRILHRFNSTLNYSSEIVKEDIGWNKFTIVCKETFKD
jgi:two-component system sensor histidine kinase ArlS